MFFEPLNTRLSKGSRTLHNGQLIASGVSCSLSYRPKVLVNVLASAEVEDPKSLRYIAVYEKKAGF